MPKTFAQQIRDIMRTELKDRPTFTYDDIALRLDLVSGKERRPLYKAMKDFFDRGEVERVRPGVLRYRGKGYEVRTAEKTGCMYRLIRANRRGSLTINDLVANCGVSERTAREYLQVLVRNGVMRRIPMPANQPHKYQMVDDPGPNLVRNAEKARKLRKLREVKALARESLCAIRQKLDIAVAAIESIEDE